MIQQKIKMVVLFSLLYWNVVAQEKYTLSGVVKDNASNETLIGATVYVPQLKTGVSTNQYGFYTLTLPAGNYEITVQYVGYQSQNTTVNLQNNLKQNFSLIENSQQLNEVVIVQNKKKANIKSPEMSVAKLSMAEVKKMPVVLGETDVLKSILQLPGVTNAGEGQSGFNVRGGSADQNLILLDEATIYNSSHLFGFFSVFNADAIKDLKLYKGGIPARYGGRVSSVLDIYQKDGNSKSFHMNGGIGLISSRLLAEGPIVKDKGSFLVAGRASYAHLFLKASGNDNSAYFYDLNTKLNYKLSENNNLFLSGYFGRDVFNINDNFQNTYGNAVVNLRWNHLFSDQLFSNLSLIYSDYYYGLTLNFVGFNWDSGIKNYNLKYDFKHSISDRWKLAYGANVVYYDFNPGTIRPTNASSNINPDQLEKKYALEPAIYIEAEQKVSENISLNYGVRNSWFYRLGAQNVNNYTNNEAVVWNNDLKIYEKGVPSSTQYYGKNKTIAQFQNLEPRFAISWAINDDTSIKASYNKMSQYLHLISNTASPTPLDVWAPADTYLQPQLLHQWALGYFKNWNNDTYTLEAETFYKTVKNKIDYIDGADLIANKAIEQVVLNGQSRAYGLELLLRKNTGNFTGWVAYTLSKTEQQTPGRTADEFGINNGKWYRSGYDKTHNLAITTSYLYSKKWTFGALFTLQSGQPVTYPNGYYEYQGLQIPNYGARNENRLPIYHHLDVSATLTPAKNAHSSWKGEWVFSIYNLYNRKNAASISFRQNETSGNNEAVRLSIFGMVPSVTYNFKF